MNKHKYFGILVIVFVVAALFAAGCATQSNSPSPNVSSQPPKTSQPVTSATSALTTPASPAISSSTQPPANISTGSKPKSFPSAPAMQIDTSKNYTATVDTSLGTFKIQLFASETPKTVNNFVFLSNQGFYNGIIFHRIIKTFMVQTGDPTGTGMGSPGYKFADELPPKHKYDIGIVAMANSGPNTNGSQFFICTGANAANLNYQPNYTQFGQVIEGMDVVQKIASVQVAADPNTGETSKPVNPPVINSITISVQ